jgi:hypothetical protein
VRMSEGLKLRRGRAVDPESQGPSDLHVISCIGDSRVEAPSCCNENCDIAILRYPDEPRTVHQFGRVSEDSRKSEFGHRGFQR